MINARIKSLFLLAILLLPLLVSNGKAVANEMPDFIGYHVETPKLVGQGEYQRLFWKIYLARLYARDGIYKPDHAFALQLEYQRDLKADDIVEMSIGLIEDQGVSDLNKLAHWQTQLAAIIPDIRKGDQLTGIQLNEKSFFYLDDKPIGEITDAELSQYFFDIWLGENTTAPELRKTLIGQRSPNPQ